MGDVKKIKVTTADFQIELEDTDGKEIKKTMQELIDKLTPRVQYVQQPTPQIMPQMAQQQPQPNWMKPTQ